MEREWSRIATEKMQPAIDAIFAGVIPLTVPPYAVAGSLLAIGQYAQAVLRSEEQSLDVTVLEEVLGGPAHIENLWELVLERGLDWDFDIFVDCLEEQLVAWLDDRDSEAPDELDNAVVMLLENLGQELLSAQRQVVNVLYLRAVEICTGELPLRLPAVGSVPALELYWTNKMSMEAYADYLDKTDQKEAAEHVREVCLGITSS